MTRFCVECGKETEDLVNGLCIECFLRDRQLVSLPEHLNLQICSNCGRYPWHGSWIHADVQDMAVKLARENLKPIKEARVVATEGSAYFQDDYNLCVTLKCRVAVSDFETDAAATTVVRVKNTVCQICSRRLGNYYESILQIRAPGRERTLDPELQDEVLAKVERKVDAQGEFDANAFITKMEIVPGGVDVYLSQIALGKSISKDLGEEYCAETDEASKLVGQSRDGIEMYRVSYLVRLPEFHVGDVVRHQKGYWLLARVNGTGGRLTSLKDFRETSVRRKDMPELKVYCKAAELEEATVVSSMPGEIQVMDPRSYATVDLLVPEGADIGDAVRVVRIDDVLYYVPPLKEGLRFRTLSSFPRRGRRS